MVRIRVSSSTISSIGYDHNSKTLEVEFKNGSIYEYYNVPLNIYEGLMSASSIGKYFNDRIKEGGYRFRHIR